MTTLEKEQLVVPRELTWRERHMMDFYYELDNSDLKITRMISLPVFIFLYIPATILELFACIWDGGLKNFRPLDRYVGTSRYYYFDKGKWKSDLIEKLFKREQEAES